MTAKRTGWKALIAGFLTLVTLTGCVGYQLGSMLPPDIDTVYVPTFVNKTGEPLIEIDTTQATIEQLQQDGSLEVVNEDQADAILEVVLTDYSLTPVSFQRNEETRAEEYRITIMANVVLKRRVTGEVIMENPRVSGEADFVFAGDLASSKRRALPRAARDFGHDVVERVVEAW